MYEVCQTGTMKFDRICVVGGGASAHAAVALLGQSGKSVKVLTRRPSEWASKIRLDWATEDLETSFQGPLDLATSDFREVEGSDVFLLCLPVHQLRGAIDRIFSQLDPNADAVLGSIYGQGGIDWMVNHSRAKHRVPQVSFFSFGLIPWIVRTTRYGQSAVTYGQPKENNIVSVENP